MCNGCYIVSELQGNLKSGYYSSNLDYDNVDWFVDEIKKLETLLAFSFKNILKKFYNGWIRSRGL